MNDPHHDAPVVRLDCEFEDADLVMILLHVRGATSRDILGLASEFGEKPIAHLAPQAAENTWYPNSFLAPIESNATVTAISEGVRGYALDPDAAEALWRKSEELVGESFI